MFYRGREHKTTIFFFFCEARYSPLPSYDKLEELEWERWSLKQGEFFFLDDIFASVAVVVV